MNLPNQLEQRRRKLRPTKRGEWDLLRMKKGFTLIELLVVIAVIAILAAIAFPVFARSKDSAYRSSDMSKLNEIRTALQLYRTDQGAYPPALLGYATSYWSPGVPGNPDPAAGDIVPADQVMGALYPKRVDSVETFRPANNRQTNDAFSSQFTTAVWPPPVSGDAGAGQSGQRFGTDTEANRCVNGATIPRYFYDLSGFDSATVKAGPSATRRELRYTLFWSGWTVPADPCAPAANEMGSGSDNPRQLGYSDPPDTTVVTWDSYFRELDASGNPQPGKREIVLFLGGSAKMMSSKAVIDNGYLVQP